MSANFNYDDLITLNLAPLGYHFWFLVRRLTQVSGTSRDLEGDPNIHLLSLLLTQFQPNYFGLKGKRKKKRGGEGGAGGGVGMGGGWWGLGGGVGGVGWVLERKEGMWGLGLWSFAWVC